MKGKSIQGRGNPVTEIIGFRIDAETQKHLEVLERANPGKTKSDLVRMAIVNASELVGGAHG